MTDTPTPILQSPDANPAGLDGEPLTVRAAWDALDDKSGKAGRK